MILGAWNELKVTKKTDFGIYLADQEGDVLLPIKQVPAGTAVGDKMKVFIYKDSSDRLISTVNQPLIEIGQIRKLTVKSATANGAYLDWGLEKDILLPFKEQTCKVQEGKSYLVRLYEDKSHRLAASMRLYGYLKKNEKYEKGNHVNGTVYEYKKGLGAFVAIDNEYYGMIHESEIFSRIEVGDEVRARVVNRRPDGKTDLALREEVYVQMKDDSEMVFDVIKSYGGILPFDDKADIELIRREFGLSKNAFKRAVGRLYKERKIELKDGRIYIVEE
ncbi:MAG: S1 RNA-binding domain-containing protein [Eubacterium sp.]|nr:S1 RNA-binding domain-containing protein [Eubacterium sp.]